MDSSQNKKSKIGTIRKHWVVAGFFSCLVAHKIAHLTIGSILGLLQCIFKVILHRTVWGTEKLSNKLKAAHLVGFVCRLVMSISCDPMDCSLPGSSVHGTRQEYWSGLPFTLPSGLPNKTTSLQAGPLCGVVCMLWSCWDFGWPSPPQLVFVPTGLLNPGL